MSVEQNTMTHHLNIAKYIAKYRSEFELGNDISYNLPSPTNALSTVTDSENWNCYPEDVIRLYLTKAPWGDNLSEERWLVGFGDYGYPTICTKYYDSLDDACAFIHTRPEPISKAWLEKAGFEFSPISKPFHV